MREQLVGSFLHDKYVLLAPTSATFIELFFVKNLLKLTLCIQWLRHGTELLSPDKVKYTTDIKLRSRGRNMFLCLRCSILVELMILLWGIRLCIMVRKAPSEFNESRFISMTIYNEFLLSIFLNVSM